MKQVLEFVSNRDCFKNYGRAVHLSENESVAKSSWPNIRGPEWNGHAQEQTLASNWPKEGPPVLWTRELGQGYSSFIAWDDSIATQYQNLSGQYVICLDANTGATKWEHRYSWPYDPAGVYPGPRSTPTFDAGSVYFTSPSGLLGSLNAESGRLNWSVDLEKRFKISVPGFGYACSPMVVDDKVILPVGAEEASLVAFDKRDGSIRWIAIDSPPKAAQTSGKPRESIASYCSVYPITFRNRKCVVCYLQNSLLCCDSDTGELLWRYSLSSGYDEHSAWPIYEEPYLWITGAFQRGSELLELTDDTEFPIRMVRQSKLMSNDIFSSVLHEGALFGFDLQEAQAKTHRTSRGIFRCIDSRTGQELWSVGSGRIQRSMNSDSNASSQIPKTIDGEIQIGHSTVLIADGKLILLNDLGELILARASQDKYKELGRASILGGEICWTQPAIAKSKLFVRNQSRAACVFLGPPESLPDELRTNSLTVSQIPQSKFRDVASLLLGVEPEYLFDLPSIEWLKTWFWISLIGIIAISFALSRLPICALWIYLQSGGATSRKGALPSKTAGNFVFHALAFLFGAFGTTFLSRWTHEFVFTWPVCLFVAWQVALANSSKKSVPRNGWARWQSTGSAVFLLGSCFVYFLLCRRLSLVFEWVFLTGFLATLPFHLAANSCFAGKRWAEIWQFLMTCLGFTAYYWASAAILFLRPS